MGIIIIEICGHEYRPLVLAAALGSLACPIAAALLRHINFMCSSKEETRGRHEPLPCRHKPLRFARPTEPPPCNKSLRYAVKEHPLYSTAAWFLHVI